MHNTDHASVFFVFGAFQAINALISGRDMRPFVNTANKKDRFRPMEKMRSGKRTLSRLKRHYIPIKYTLARNSHEAVDKNLFEHGRTDGPDDNSGGLFADGTGQDRKSTRLNSSHSGQSRMPSSA